ncbi:TlyA family RNA methyltransferase [Desulfoplanes formicivorans]|uniref:Hemolysin n=1 Tax=Desulfoplanes formicivorans TaxID=1592317 RepID=A0A194AIM9_9BACT|nr:TlyA family RNA methyltransferase [Desulfoplanes formicivorans]GAU09942.1 hemolysin [Desulfoplanes formicivorans]
MALKKLRADRILVDQGTAPHQDAAMRLVMAGLILRVLPNGEKVPVVKPGEQFPLGTRLEKKGESRFVSRGGYKLLTALDHFAPDIAGVVALDAGASTGGFTDCLLQHGAARVYGVDVGYGQLHWKLRQDPRVVVMERVNLRTAPADLIGEPVDLIVIDCSFISLKLILPPCLQYLRPGGEVIALVKPQFEVQAHQTDRGVVRSRKDQERVVASIMDFAATRLCLTPMGFIPAMIKGPKGNQEYLVYLKHNPTEPDG